MALSSALFSGISGLSTLGNAMQIVGDNIANVNTVGFKGSTFTFQDLLSQATSTMSGNIPGRQGNGAGRHLQLVRAGLLRIHRQHHGPGRRRGRFLRDEGVAKRQSLLHPCGQLPFRQGRVPHQPEGYVVQGWELDETARTSAPLTTSCSAPSPPRPRRPTKVEVDRQSGLRRGG